MKSEIYHEQGVTGVKINGKVYPFAATRSFRPEGRILKAFSDHEMKFFNIFPSGIMTALQKRTVPYSQFGPVWVGDHEYNWDNLRLQCEEIFGSIAPDAYVSVNVHLDPPSWYVDSHPELRDHWEQMIQNLGSLQWREEAADYLRALIDKLDEWYPERVYAIFLMCGGTTEWYSYHADTVISQPTELQQRTFARHMGDESARIPSPEVLHSAADGVIRDAQQQKAAIDYWKFTNEIVMETILYFAKVAKEHTHRSRLVGLFTGQIYGMCLDWGVRISYNRIDMMLSSPDVDMLFCPASYVLRKLESTSAIRMPVDSISLHKKLFVHEIDSSTHLLKKSKDSAAASHAGGRDEPFTCTSDTVMYIRRETGIVLAKNQGYWWFDMFSGYYDDPELMNEIQRIGQVQQELIRRPSAPVSEVVEMLDVKSNYHIATNSYYPMAEHQSAALNKTGAPWDQGYTFDLTHPDFDEERYKLYILPALFAPEKQTAEKIQQLRRKGKCMLYMHAPYYAEEGLSTGNMTRRTGITFERCELTDNTVRLCIPGAEHVTYAFTNHTWPGDVWHHQGGENITPIFSPTNLDLVLGRFEENGAPACGVKFREDGGFDAFSACAPVPVEFLREIYRLAGIFMYADRPVPVYTSSSFECVYCYEGGEVTLYRPQPSVLQDCFTGEKICVDKRGTRLTFAPHETRFFYVTRR